LSDVDKVNDYVAGISYLPGCAGGFSSSVGSASPSDDLYLYDFELEPYLQRLRPTVPGLDAIPSWFFSKCSYELADIVAFIFNSSFTSDMVPEHWKRSVVTPVPKVARQTSISEFRPILVILILSLLAEKLVVKKLLFPALDPTTVSDQFAFSLGRLAALRVRTYVCFDLLHAPCH